MIFGLVRSRTSTQTGGLRSPTMLLSKQLWQHWRPQDTAQRDSHHYRVIESLELTIQADPKLTRQFDAFRKKRNISSYETSGAVSDREAQEMRALAVNLRGQVEKWIRDNYPELL